MTYRELAKMLGVHPVTLSRAINAKVRPTDENAKKFEEVTGISFVMWKRGEAELLRRETRKFLARTKGKVKSGKSRTAGD